MRDQLRAWCAFALVLVAWEDPSTALGMTHWLGWERSGQFKMRAIGVGFPLLYVICAFGVLASCGSKRSIPQAVEGTYPGTEPGLSLEFKSYSDEYFGGKGAVGYTFRVENVSRRPIGPCTVTLNDTYASSLSEIRVGGWGLKGANKLGTDGIARGMVLSIMFNHDVTNSTAFTDGDGNVLRQGTTIESIAFDCGDESYRWTL